MRKKILIVVSVVILIVITLVAIMYYRETQSEKIIISADSEKEAVYEEIALNFKLTDKQSETCCYADGTLMLFSVGTRNGKATGPLVNTDEIIEYDYNNEEVIFRYSVNSGGYITGMLPYDDGIIYVDYTECEYGEVSAYDFVKWQLIYMTKNGNVRVLDEGKCAYYDDIPLLDTIDGNPIYLYYLEQNEKGNRWGINIVDNLTIKNIIKNDNYALSNLNLMSNGEKYAVLASEDIESEYGIYLVGDKKGIIFECQLDMKIVSDAMTEDYLICSEANDEFNQKLLKVDLNGGKTEQLGIFTILYRLKDIGGNKCLAFKGNNDLSLTMLDILNSELIEFNKPTLESKSDTLGLYPIGNGKIIVMEYGDPDKYFLMTYQ